MKHINNPEELYKKTFFEKSASLLVMYGLIVGFIFIIFIKLLWRF